jgi:Two component regulator propeller
MNHRNIPYPLVACMFLFWGCANFVMAQSIGFMDLFKQFQENQENTYLLPNKCNQIYEDSRGMVWIATDNGVVKYDGFLETKYLKEFNGKKVSIIREDSKGNLWFMSKIGLVKYDGSRFSVVDYGKPLRTGSRINGDIHTQFVVMPDFVINSKDEFLILDYGKLSRWKDGKYMASALDSVNVNKIGYCNKYNEVFIKKGKNLGIQPKSK